MDSVIRCHSWHNNTAEAGSIGLLEEIGGLLKLLSEPRTVRFMPKKKESAVVCPLTREQLQTYCREQEEPCADSRPADRGRHCQLIESAKIGI